MLQVIKHRKKRWPVSTISGCVWPCTRLIEHLTVRHGSDANRPSAKVPLATRTPFGKEQRIGASFSQLPRDHTAQTTSPHRPKAKVHSLLKVSLRKPFTPPVYIDCSPQAQTEGRASTSSRTEPAENRRQSNHRQQTSFQLIKPAQTH